VRGGALHIRKKSRRLKKEKEPVRYLVELGRRVSGYAPFGREKVAGVAGNKWGFGRVGNGEMPLVEGIKRKK